MTEVEKMDSDEYLAWVRRERGRSKVVRGFWGGSNDGGI